MRTVALPIMWAAVLLLSGCSRVESPDALMGSYKLVLPHATVLLDLKNDHSFTEQINYENGQRETASGEWAWKERCINLPDALYPKEARDLKAQGSEKTNWCLNGVKSFGKTRLEVNDDMGFNFEKAK